MKSHQSAEAIPELKSLNRVLTGIVWVSVLIALFYLVFPFIDSRATLILETIDGVEEVVSGELSTTDRLVVAGMMSLAKFCWLMGLIPLVSMTNRFAKGVIFEKRNLKAVQCFGVSLLLVGVVSSIDMFLVSVYLKSVDVLKGASEFLPFYILEQAEYVTAGLFILVIGQVLKKALEYSEEAELTI